MPHPDELPENIRPLARCNAVRLTHERFRSDVQGLVKALQRELEEIALLRSATIGAVNKGPEPHEPALQSSRRALLIACVLGVLLAGSVGLGLRIHACWRLRNRRPCLCSRHQHHRRLRNRRPCQCGRHQHHRRLTFRGYRLERKSALHSLEVRTPHCWVHTETGLLILPCSPVTNFALR